MTESILARVKEFVAGTGTTGYKGQREDTRLLLDVVEAGTRFRKALEHWPKDKPFAQMELAESTLEFDAALSRITQEGGLNEAPTREAATGEEKP